ncbi:MAG: hypothetical protein QXN52_09825, partial [Nitrososphaerota archaeon]
MSIFKPGDIRGIYPNEINEELVYKIGLYFAGFAKGIVVVAGDFRNGTISLKDALIRGLSTSEHLKIFDLGQTTTPIFYFSSRLLKSEWGFMITASHNTYEFNGMKIIKGIFPLLENEIYDIEKGISNLRLSHSSHNRAEQLNLESEYIESLKAKINIYDTKKRVVFDIGNGAVGKIIDKVISGFNLNATVLFKEPDAMFPSRNPNPALKESLYKLQNEVTNNMGSIGFAFDGDGDRLAVVDENANIVPSDIVASVFIDCLARKDEKVVYDIKSSSLIKKTILKKGSVPIMERSGYPYIKRTFVESNAILATEVSGHYFFREILQDDAIFASLKLLEILNDKDLSQIKRYYVLPYITPDIRIVMYPEEIEKIIKELEEKLVDIVKIDGIYKEFENGFGLVRKSITEPVITLRFEGKDKL